MRRLRSLLLWMVLLAPWQALAKIPTSVAHLLDNHRVEALADPDMSDVPLSVEEARASADAVWLAYQREQNQNPSLAAADRMQVVQHGDNTMRYHVSTVGQPDPAGYPLYIALHAGGSGPAYANDNQWEYMKTYYKSSIKNGIYVAPRAISNTQDMHFRPEAYPLYKKLIAQMILLHEVDPDRVYLLGFSTGGDGVYQVATRIGDRLAAASMSAGHPNGTSPVNLQHVPFLLQVGEQDRIADRNRITVAYDAELATLHATDSDGYQHELFVHAGKGHNFYDNDPYETVQPTIADPLAWIADANQRAIASRNTNAIAWLDQFSRDPCPRELVWDLTTVVQVDVDDGPRQHHWLDIGRHTAETLGTQEVRARVNAANNAIYIEGARTYLKIWVNSHMLNLDAPVRIMLQGETKELTLKPNLKYQVQSVLTRGDPRTMFDTAVALHETTEGWKTTAP